MSLELSVVVVVRVAVRNLFYQQGYHWDFMFDWRTLCLGSWQIQPPGVSFTLSPHPTSRAGRDLLEQIRWMHHGTLARMHHWFSKVFLFSFQRRVSYIWPPTIWSFWTVFWGKTRSQEATQHMGQTNENGTGNGVPIPFTGRCQVKPWQATWAIAGWGRLAMKMEHIRDVGLDRWL